MLYSLVVPIYHDAELAEDFSAAFETTFQGYMGKEDIAGDAEVIFVSDDGTPETTGLLTAVCERFPFAKFIELNRNFGQHVALSCGYRHATGELVGTLNVDQEDPPDQIPVLIDALDGSDAEMALCVRERGEGAKRRRVTSLMFNWLLNKLTGQKVPLSTGTLRLMRRRTVDLLNALPERSRYLPGLEGWFGFRTLYVPTKQQPAHGGGSSYNTRRRLKLGFEAIISFSDLPLRLVVLLGMTVSVVGVLLAAALLITQVVGTDYRPGYTSTVAVIVLVGGMQIAVVGVASLYIGRILTEVQRRPLYVVRRTHGLELDQGDPGE